MDFADGSDFVKGIIELDVAAKSAGVYALSGVSSFPVLTAAVVRSLSSSFTQVLSIKGGIAPSPYAGVGLNVIRAIAAYAGKPVQLTRNKTVSTAYGLTESIRYTIGPPGYRPLRNIRFSLVDVPDLQLLPDLWPGLDSIWMGAGPVPEVLHRMLNGLAWLVRIRLLPSLSPFAPIFFYAIKYLRWGAHRGGMFVEVQGIQSAGTLSTRSWHLLAEGNDGPYIPCMALQAIIERSLAGNNPPFGARPASLDLELQDYERLFEKRTIYTGQRDAVAAFDSLIFRNVLGSAWKQLPNTLKELHQNASDDVWSGTAKVERGAGFWAKRIASIFKFPKANQSVPVEVKISTKVHVEQWKRTFGQQTFVSTLRPGEDDWDKLMSEQLGPFRFGIALIIENKKLYFKVQQWKLWNIPLPAIWAPIGNSYEFERDGKFHFHVEIAHPLLGLIVRYQGHLSQYN